MNPVFPISTHIRGDVVVLAPEGEIDIATAPALLAAVDQAVSRRTARVVFDLAKVTFMDSTGLKVMMHAYRQVGARREAIEVANGSPAVRRLIGIVGIDQVITIT